VQHLTISARPTPLTIDSAHSPALVIGTQNDFGPIDGMFYRAGIDLSVIRMAVPRTFLDRAGWYR
jgi:ureidoacrylate peracid hydrolase